MRQLLCQSCGDRWKLHKDDIKVGITSVKIRVRLSPDAQFDTSDGGAKCDICGKSLPAGEVVWYVAAFKPGSAYSERDAGSWRNFGKFVSDREFKAITVLTKD